MSIDVNGTYRDGALHPGTAKERLGGDLRALRAQTAARGGAKLKAE